MGKIYGGRWETIRTIGEGGQSHVFEVKDLSGEMTGTFALKRVKNLKRHERFAAEISAIKKLSHPNVINLIDHSALDAVDGAVEKQFMVMPLAGGGDLSSRVKVYAGSVDGVLAVVQPLASALSSAHALGIIHRDVKPANVLFTDAGNSPWLADFGICLIRDADRNTETDEVAGPWAYMAPELEAGGRLEVSQAADVYSLGKLIYYMITGGIVLPRERLDEPEFAAVFEPGGRYHHLELLLRRMICPLDARIADMEEVGRALARISDWDRNSVVPPFSPNGRNRIEALQRRVVEQRQKDAEHQSTVEANDAITSLVKGQVIRWMEGELEKAAALLAEGEALQVSVNSVPDGDLGYADDGELFAEIGVELVVSGLDPRRGTEHVLQMLVCQRRRFQVITHMGPGPIPNRPVKEAVLLILPRYKTLPGGTRPNRDSNGGYFFTESNRLFPVSVRERNRSLPHMMLQRSNQEIGNPRPNVLCLELPTSAWPASETHLADFMRRVGDNFLETLTQSDGNFLHFK